MAEEDEAGGFEVMKDLRAALCVGSVSREEALVVWSMTWIGVDAEDRPDQADEDAKESEEAVLAASESSESLCELLG